MSVRLIFFLFPPFLVYPILVVLKNKKEGGKKAQTTFLFLFLVGLWVSVCIKDSCTLLLR